MKENILLKTIIYIFLYVGFLLLFLIFASALVSFVYDALETNQSDSLEKIKWFKTLAFWLQISSFVLLIVFVILFIFVFFVRTIFRKEKLYREIEKTISKKLAGKTAFGLLILSLLIQICGTVFASLGNIQNTIVYGIFSFSFGILSSSLINKISKAEKTKEKELLELRIEQLEKRIKNLEKSKQ